MGALMRRYWHPVGGVDEMRERWTKRVKILGEELVLFRDRSGKFGLITEQCPHRRASLAYGIPTEDGIRCPYHGWKFDRAGSCLEQPNEPEGSTFKDKTKTATPAYPVQAFAGLLWTYMGPLPAPLIPALDGLVAPNAIRMCGITRVKSNWLQIQENSLDPVHTEWLHGHLYNFVKEQQGVRTDTAFARHHKKIAFDEFKYGIIKRRLMEGQPETASDWTTGHPILFPNVLAVSSGDSTYMNYLFQWRVPIDDTTTEHYWYTSYTFPEGTEIPQHLLDHVPVFAAPQKNESGQYDLEYVYGQDPMAWETQGPIAQRQLEKLGTTDVGIIMLRQMLQRELAKVERGEDPMYVIRNPQENECIVLPKEMHKDMNEDGFESQVRRNINRFSPFCEEVIDLYKRSRRQPVLA
jgi:5,5'-dehydrodivanillate O-demethylase